MVDSGSGEAKRPPLRLVRTWMEPGPAFPRGHMRITSHACPGGIGDAAACAVRAMQLTAGSAGQGRAGQAARAGTRARARPQRAAASALVGGGRDDVRVGL